MTNKEVFSYFHCKKKGWIPKFHLYNDYNCIMSVQLCNKFCVVTQGEVSSDIQYRVWVADPTNLNVTVDKEFTDDGSGLRYEVVR